MILTCALRVLLLSMSEEGSSEASASDAKRSAAAGNLPRPDVNALHKIIKLETVREELATERPSASSILKSHSKGSFNLIVALSCCRQRQCFYQGDSIAIIYIHYSDINL